MREGDCAGDASEGVSVKEPRYNLWLRDLRIDDVLVIADKLTDEKDFRNHALPRRVQKAVKQARDRMYRHYKGWRKVTLKCTKGSDA